jgi:hypothetical protein
VSHEQWGFGGGSHLARAGLEALEPAERPSAGDIRAMVEELGALKAVLDHADRGDLTDLYSALRL